MLVKEVVARLRQVLAGRKDVRVAVLFGSEARGTARAGSDVDIAVDAPDADILGLAAVLSEALAREVDVLSLAK